MRGLLVLGALTWTTLLAGCGGSSTLDGTGGSGTGAASGSGGSAGSTGGSAGSGGTAGSGGAAGSGGQNSCGPETKKCSEPTECLLVTQDCCLCGMPELKDYQAVNSKYEAQCSCGGPICDCMSGNNANLAATCRNSACEGFDVRKVEAFSGCTKDDDCTLRMGLDCCEGCGSSAADLVAVAKTGGPALMKAVCPGGPIGCPACAPQYPDNKKAACVSKHCQVVDK